MKKFLICGIIALCLATTACSGNAGEPIATSDITPIQTPDETQQADENIELMEQDIAKVVVGDTHTIGLRSDGKLYRTGNNIYGQCSVKTWADIKNVYTTNYDTIGLKNDGTLLISGKHQEEWRQILNETDVVDVALADDFAIVLNTDGDMSIYGALDNFTPTISNIKRIVANNKIIAVLSASGKVSAFSIDGVFDTSLVDDWSEIIDVQIGENYIIGLKNDGTVCSTNNRTEGWTDIKSIYAGKLNAVGVKNDGKLECIIKTDELSKLDNVSCVSFASEHTAVMFNDGTVSVFGTDEQLQIGNSGFWHLLPYIDDNGLLIGLPANGTDELYKELLDKMANGKTVEYDSLGTGSIVKIGDEQAVVAMVGDINSDAKIDDGDVQALEEYIATDMGDELINKVANFNGDNKINETDIFYLKQYASNYREPIAYLQNMSGMNLKENLSEALEINKDVVGWITINDTQIDRAILYSDTPAWFYNDHDIYGKKSNRGEVYTYYGTRTKNSVITAHNMRITKTMFNELHKFKDEPEKLKDFKNRIIDVAIYGSEETKWEIFAIYETKAGVSYDVQKYNTQSLNNADSETVKEWISTQLENSVVDLGISVSADDTFVTLVTCSESHADSNNNARLYIFLRAIG